MKPAALPLEQSLADQYRQAHALTMRLAGQLLDERVRQDKLAHPSLPEVTLRQLIVQHRGCPCAIANQILEP
jgi:hypothetical protein